MRTAARKSPRNAIGTLYRGLALSAGSKLPGLDTGKGQVEAFFRQPKGQQVLHALRPGKILPGYQMQHANGLPLFDRKLPRRNFGMAAGGRILWR